MKCRLTRDMKCPRPDPAFPDGIKPKGTLIDHRQAALLVRMGVAEPADEECQQKAGMTPQRMAAAADAYTKVEKGIAPEDYEAFDQGLMVGYDGNGEWIPGPNFDEAAWEERKRTSNIIIVEDE